jgi:hypothetical protein
MIKINSQIDIVASFLRCVGIAENGQRSITVVLPPRRVLAPRRMNSSPSHPTATTQPLTER